MKKVIAKIIYTFGKYFSIVVSWILGLVVAVMLVAGAIFHTKEFFFLLSVVPIALVFVWACICLSEWAEQNKD